MRFRAKILPEIDSAALRKIEILITKVTGANRSFSHFISILSSLNLDGSVFKYSGAENKQIISLPI